jgi:hypothetical protein
MKHIKLYAPKEKEGEARKKIGEGFVSSDLSYQVEAGRKEFPMYLRPRMRTEDLRRRDAVPISEKANIITANVVRIYRDGKFVHWLAEIRNEADRETIKKHTGDWIGN